MGTLEYLSSFWLVTLFDWSPGQKEDRSSYPLFDWSPGQKEDRSTYPLFDWSPFLTTTYISVWSVVHMQPNQNTFGRCCIICIAQQNFLKTLICNWKIEILEKIIHRDTVFLIYKGIHFIVFKDFWALRMERPSNHNSIYTIFENDTRPGIV